MGDEGRGTSSMSESNPSVLDPQTAALVRVAAAVARGKAPELNARFAAARDARVPGLWIEELLLQSMIEAVLGVIDDDLDSEQRRTVREQWEDVKGRRL